MNKVYLFVLPLALIMLAYSGDSISQKMECEKAPEPAKNCEGDPQTPTIKLNLTNMKASPRCVKAHPGTTLVFRITTKRGLKLDTIKILPKDPGDFWLKGQNDLIEDLIIIRIPGTHDPNNPNGPTDHYYRIVTPDRCLDPRVQVED